MMKCCLDCFSDELAKEILRDSPEASGGECDLCHKSKEKLYVIASESELAYRFEELFDVFAPVGRVRGAAVRPEARSLFDAFRGIWNVFTEIDEEGFCRLARELFPDDGRIEEMIASPVVLAPNRGAGSPSQYCVFGERSWEEFSDDIKHRGRYRAKMEHEEILARLMRSLDKVVRKADGEWYRARIWNGKAKPPEYSDLYEPGRDKASEGRMSPRGVSCLYIANSPMTAMAEIRAAMHDEVAVASMVPKRTLHIVDLSRVSDISPFSSDVNCAELAANMSVLRCIREDLTRPMRAGDNPIEYVPTQYIADCARDWHFDGIGYNSVMQAGGGEAGYNIACFDGAKDNFEFKNVQVYKVSKIQYTATLR